MNPLWLLVDVSNLAFRAYHTTGRLAAGTCFGFLNQLKVLQARYQTRRVAFCFDRPPSLREALLPAYKESRKTDYAKMPPRERADRDEMRAEIRRLLYTILPELGYRNIFAVRGYEADDLIAACCSALPKGDDAVIVSSDRDLYQCLGPQVQIDKGGKQPRYTQADLKQEFFGLTPKEWPSVKAIAGCGTDDVPGVDGVGDITAAKFLRGRLKESLIAYKAIAAGRALWLRNLPLVRLPFKGTPAVELVDDEGTATPARWRAVAHELGMDSLLRGPSWEAGAGMGVFTQGTRPAPAGS